MAYFNKKTIAKANNDHKEFAKQYHLNNITKQNITFPNSDNLLNFDNILFPNTCEQFKNSNLDHESEKIKKEKEKEVDYLEEIIRLKEVIKSKGKNSESVNILNKESMSLLEQFEYEQSKKELERKSQLVKLQQEKNEKEKLAKIEEEKRNEETKLFQRIVDMFNDKMSLLTQGIDASYPEHPGYVRENGKKQIKIVTNTIQKIKYENIDKLYNIYSKIIQDLIWIKKYVIGSKTTNPYIDFVFDNFINNIDNIIISYDTKIKNMIVSSNPHQQTYYKYISQLKELKKINQPREYYYYNFNDCILNYNKKGIEKYNNPIDNYIIEHEWMQKQSEIMNYLNNFMDTYHVISSNKDILDSHIRMIRYNRSGSKYKSKWVYSEFYTKSDFDDLIKLGYIFIELIEFIRPKIKSYKKSFS